MSRPDDEFEDFLTRRKLIFSRSAEEPLEPPDEVDRLVLHQAREAVEGARPQRVFTGPRWGTPLAIAATLVLALTVILQVGMPAKPEPIPVVTVQTVAQRLDPPAAPPAAAGVVAENPVTDSQVIDEVSAPPTEAESAVPEATTPPAFRGDSRTWLAEIERLRAAGQGARAEAEFAEYKRQHRAYAVSPDR